MKKQKMHPVLFVFLSLITVDITFLTWWVLMGGGNTLNSRLGVLEKRVDTIVKREGYESELGDQVLVNKAAAEAVKSIKPELDAMQQGQVGTDGEAEEVLGTSDEIREYFVPMGSGSTQKKEWADVPSLQATVNSDRYGEIVEVFFEASMRAVGGKVEARILDRTNGSVIHESNLEYEGSELAWKFSKPFILPEGGQTYIVQLRSSLGEVVEIGQARLRILATM